MFFTANRIALALLVMPCKLLLVSGLTGVRTYIPRDTLRLSQNCHLSERFCDRVLFNYVSFIWLPQEIKTVVSIIGVISVVKYIANLLKL